MSQEEQKTEFETAGQEKPLSLVEEFLTFVKENKKLYGYVLVEAEETLKSVMKRIKKRLKDFDKGDSFPYFHLFHPGEGSVCLRLWQNEGMLP